jgi:hypothetical protein
LLSGKSKKWFADLRRPPPKTRVARSKVSAVKNGATVSVSCDLLVKKLGPLTHADNRRHPLKNLNYKNSVVVSACQRPSADNISSSVFHLFLRNH